MPRISDLPLTSSVDEATSFVAVSAGGVTYKISLANALAATGVSFPDSDDSHLITLAGGSNLSANRTLTLTTGDANRTLDISAGDTTISAFAITFLDDADAAAVRATLGLGTMALETATDYLTVAAAASGYQPLDADLTTIAATVTAFGLSLIDDVNAAAARTTLGLGTAAVQNTGTSGTNVPLLDGVNTWSGFTTFTANVTVQKASAVLRVAATSGDSNGYISAVPGSAATFRWGSWDGVSHSERWLFGKDGTAESGSNVGSDFAVYSYTDAGAFLATVLTITRSNSGANFRGGVYSNGATGGNQGANTLNFTTLYENGTSLASKYGALASANSWTATQTITTTGSFETTLQLISTNGDALAGPILNLYRNSASPVAADVGGMVQFRGNNSAGTNKIMGQMQNYWRDPTAAAEYTSYAFTALIAGVNTAAMEVSNGVIIGSPTGFYKGTGTLNAVTLYENGTSLASKYGALASSNTWTASQVITGSGSFFTGLTITSTNADANAGPYLVLRRAGGSPAASDQIGNITWQGQDSGLVDDNVANVNVLVVDPTSASEDYQLRFQVMIAGTLGTRGYFGGGLVVGSPTGGDLGGGTINASTYYQNGTIFSSVYGVLAGANSWTNTNSFSSTCTFTTTSSFGIPASFISTNADANAGPYLYLYRNSASALANDLGPTVSLRMNDSAGTAVNTSEFYAQVTDVTPSAVSAKLVFTVAQAGSASPRLTLAAGAQIGSPTGGDMGANTFNVATIYENGTALTAKYGQLTASNTWTGSLNVFGYAASSGALVEISLDTDFGAPLSVVSSQASANRGPNLLFRRASPSPAANDDAGALLFQSADDALAQQSYAIISLRCVAVTAGSITGRIRFQTYSAGSFTERFYVQAGIVVGSASGGDMGAATVNATTLYEAGTSLASKYAQLGAANTFTNPQRLPSYAVASLPAGAAGDVAFASNGRKNGEGAGAGTGVLVFHDGTAWRACDTGATVAA